MRTAGQLIIYEAKEGNLEGVCLAVSQVNKGESVCICVFRRGWCSAEHRRADGAQVKFNTSNSQEGGCVDSAR